MQDAANDSGFPAINIETGRQHDKFRAALQRHIGRHRRAHSKFSSFIITGREDAASITCPADPNRFATQFGAIADLDRRVKAIHIQMNDGPVLSGVAHVLKPTPDDRTRNSELQSGGDNLNVALMRLKRMKESQSREDLAVYVKDHYAGGIAALELLDHLVKEHRDDPLQPFFAQLRDEIKADHDQLCSLIEKLGDEDSSLRNAGAWLAEKIGRLKMGFTASADSSLRLFQSLEFLFLGITGKKALWRALIEVQSGWPILEKTDLARLEERAKEQAERVEGHRLAAARDTFRSA